MLPGDRCQRRNQTLLRGVADPGQSLHKEVDGGRGRVLGEYREGLLLQGPVLAPGDADPARERHRIEWVLRQTVQDLSPIRDLAVGGQVPEGRRQHLRSRGLEDQTSGHGSRGCIGRMAELSETSIGARDLQLEERRSRSTEGGRRLVPALGDEEVDRRHLTVRPQQPDASLADRAIGNEHHPDEIPPFETLDPNHRLEKRVPLLTRAELMGLQLTQCLSTARGEQSRDHVPQAIGTAVGGQ